MDQRARELERLARAGDVEAAERWFQEVARTNDYEKILESMKLLARLQHPELFETLDMLDRIDRLTSHEGPEWDIGTIESCVGPIPTAKLF